MNNGVYPSSSIDRTITYILHILCVCINNAIVFD